MTSSIKACPKKSPEKSTKPKPGSDHLFKSEDGFVVGIVMIFFLVFTTIGLSALKTGGFEKLHAARYYHKSKAFYRAEAGLHIAIFRLNHVSPAAAAFSNERMHVYFDSSASRLTAVGFSGSVTDTLFLTVQPVSSSGNGMLRLAPNGVGAKNTFLSKSGGPNWQEVDEEETDEHGSFIHSTGRAYQTDLYNIEDPIAIPLPIDSISISYRVVPNPYGNINSMLRVGTTDYSGEAHAIRKTSVFMTYVDFYQKNPLTKQPWQWSDLTDLQIGVKAKNTVRVTQVWLDVYFTDTGGTRAGGGNYGISTWGK